MHAAGKLGSLGHCCRSYAAH